MCPWERTRLQIEKMRVLLVRALLTLVEEKVEVVRE